MSSKVNVDLMALTPGKVPPDIFNGIARLTVTPVVELVITTKNGVVLKQRPSTDAFWPNQYCLPGKIIFANGPSSVEEYVRAINENVGLTCSKDAQFCGLKLYHTKRGDELAVIYGQVFGGAIAGLRNGFEFVQFADLGSLNLVAEHTDILQAYIMNKS